MHYIVVYHVDQGRVEVSKLFTFKLGEHENDFELCKGTFLHLAEYLDRIVLKLAQGHVGYDHHVLIECSLPVLFLFVFIRVDWVGCRFNHR